MTSLPLVSVVPMLAMLLLKATLILALAFAINATLRAASAAARHLVWQVAFLGILVLPTLGLVLPRWDVPFAWASQASDAATARSTTLTESSRQGDRTPNPSDPAISAEPHAAALEAAGAQFPWSLVGLATWGIGALALGLRHSASLLHLRRFARQSLVPVTDARLLSLAGRCAGELSLPACPTLSCSPVLPTPMTWGFWRPQVALPLDAKQWDDLRVRSVLLHEMAHIRRADWLALLISRFTCAVLWFHPLVWLAARAQSFESEMAADDQVLAAGVQPSAYSSDLLAITQLSATSANLSYWSNETMFPAINITQPPIERRIRALLDPSRRRSRMSAAALTGAALVSSGILIPLSTMRLQAQDAAPPPGQQQPGFLATKSVDLATPESCLRSFVDALNRQDLSAATSCVIGGRPEVAASLAERIKAAPLQLSISGLTPQINGAEATLTVAESSIKGTAESLRNQQIPMRRDGAAWKIVPSAGALPSEQKRGPSLLAIASVLAAPDQQLTQLRQTAETQRCVNLLKQVAIAAQLYANEHQNRLGFDKATVKTSLAPFLGEGNFFECGGENKIQIAFNAKLANRLLTNIEHPASTVMFYESTGPEAAGAAGAGAAQMPPADLAYPHENRTNVVFVDGHVQAMGREDAAGLRWEP